MRAHLPTTDVTQTVLAELVSAGPNAEPRDEEVLVKIMVEMYRQFVADESSRSAFSVALNLILPGHQTWKHKAPDDAPDI